MQEYPRIGWAYYEKYTHETILKFIKNIKLLSSIIVIFTVLPH